MSTIETILSQCHNGGTSDGTDLTQLQGAGNEQLLFEIKTMLRQRNDVNAGPSERIKRPRRNASVKQEPRVKQEPQVKQEEATVPLEFIEADFDAGIDLDVQEEDGSWRDATVYRYHPAPALTREITHCV